MVHKAPHFGCLCNFDDYINVNFYQAAASRVAVHGCNKDKKRALLRDGAEVLDKLGFLIFPGLVALPMSG